jgi:hypothetical protein
MHLPLTEQDVEEEEDDNIFVRTSREVVTELLSKALMCKGHSRFGV